MYLRPDEVARVLEKEGFTMDEVTPKAYGLWYSAWLQLAYGAGTVFERPVWRRTVNLRLAFASRFTLRFCLAVLADPEQAATVVEEIAIHRPHQH